MKPDGKGTSGVLVLAESQGSHEAEDGLPLRPKAPSGSVFQGIIRRISGLDREQLTISNTIWCQPGRQNWLSGAPYEFAAIEHCQQYNAELIRSRRPRAIVALGAIPTRTITGMAGYNQGIKLLRGFILPSNRPEYMLDGKPIPVIPTYHPSFLLRASKTRARKDLDSGLVAGRTEKAEGGMALAGVVRRDIELALKIAREGVPEPYKFTTITGGPEEARAFYELARSRPELAIGWDIETPRSIDKADDESEIDSIQAHVTQIQFALDSKTGYVFPGFENPWVREWTTKILGLPNRKYTWNGWKFDNKVVQGHWGIQIAGEDIDLMSAWHWIQPSLPQGLQFCTSFYAPELPPWKHRALSDEDLYGACDVISLHINAEGIFNVMAQRGLRTSYDRHVLLLRQELNAASRRGFPVDPTRHEAFGEKIFKNIGELDDKIQLLIPDSIRLLEPKKKKKGETQHEYGYVKTPKQLLPYLDEEGNVKGGGDKIFIEEVIPLETDDNGNPTDETEIRKVTYIRAWVDAQDKESGQWTKLLRWCRIKPFSVNSGDQKIAYIKLRRNEEIEGRTSRGQSLANAERLAKYSVPQVRNKEKELKDNTGAKELEKLFKATGDILFSHLVEITKLKKLYGTYVVGWQVKKQGKLTTPEFVHTTFDTARTTTGQIASTDPNIQNLPKHSDLAKEFRFSIAAKPGKVLLDFDKKAFHAQTLAFEAKDRAYGRLSAIDVHSFMTTHRLKLPEAKDILSWSDKDIKAFFDKLKVDETTIYKSEAVPNYPNGLTFQQVRDYKSKKVILGIGFKQGAQAIFEQNPEGYKNKKEVQDFLDLFSKTFPDVSKFQREITKLAHQQTYLISKYGYIRRFHDVFKWDAKKWNAFTQREGDWSQGDDFEDAVAFLPANDAFGMIKEELLRLAGYRVPKDKPELFSEFIGSKMLWPYKDDEDLLEKYGFCNFIHDSNMFHCDYGLQDKCLEDVLMVMRQPSPILVDTTYAPGGLFVDAEAQRGPDWSHLEKLKV